VSLHCDSIRSIDNKEFTFSESAALILKYWLYRIESERLEDNTKTVDIAKIYPEKGYQTKGDAG
jgi:hypothetical protein